MLTYVKHSSDVLTDADRFPFEAADLPGIDISLGNTSFDINGALNIVSI